MLTLKPRKVPEILSLELEDKYEFYSSIVNGPKNHTIYIELDFAKLKLIPGKYDLEFQTYSQNGFTHRFGNSIYHGSVVIF